MTRAWTAALALACLPACSALGSKPVETTTASALVAQGNALAQEGEPLEARDAYLEVLRAHADDPVAFDARYGMAQLRLDQKSPLHDYRLALVNLDLLVERYGSSNPERLLEIENLRAVLRRLRSCEAKGKRLAVDADRLRELESDMDQLRELDLELEVGPCRRTATSSSSSTTTRRSSRSWRCDWKRWASRSPPPRIRTTRSRPFRAAPSTWRCSTCAWTRWTDSRSRGPRCATSRGCPSSS
jgi:hypothetical protein